MAKKSSYRPAPHNPRRIDDAALAGLVASLEVFGDLSGIVVNAKTGEIVCGHQRHAAMKAIGGEDPLAALEFGPRIELWCGHKGKRFKSKEREAWVWLPEAGRFRVREVNWPADFAHQAMLTANNAAICGDWTPEAAALLDELQGTMVDTPDAFGELLLDQLADELRKLAPKDTAAGGGDDGPKSWTITVECATHADQQALTQRLTAEGYACKCSK